MLSSSALTAAELLAERQLKEEAEASVVAERIENERIGGLAEGYRQHNDDLKAELAAEREVF